MIIELLKCQSCWRVIDQLTIGTGCKCYGRLFKSARPTWINILKWILTNPIHAWKMSHES